MVPILKTARLLLQPLTLKDAADIQALYDDYSVVKYMPRMGSVWPYHGNMAFCVIARCILPGMTAGTD
jgi:hypothetical protein